MRTLETRILLAVIPGLVFATGKIRGEQSQPEPELTNSVTPIVRYVTVKGDEARFRQDWWMKDGWAGGIDEATYQYKINKDWTLNAEARAIFKDEDYKLRLEIANPNVGFMRAGYTEYRKYFEDSGGFFRLFTPPELNPNRDLHLDIGDIYFEAGLTLPNLPKVTFGYERQFKNGAKSMLEWGSVTQGGNTRKTFPSFKDIDETVDIFKVEAEHDIGKVHLADQFHYEYYRYTNDRFDGSTNLASGASQTVTVHEHYTHDAFFNTFRLESHVTDKLYWSFGYLFTTLDGDPSLMLNTVPFANNNDKNWFTQSVAVQQNSHVLNFNMMYGPFVKGLYLYGGLQGEVTDGNGFTDATLTQITGGATNSPLAVINSDEHKKSLQETFGLRLVSIPYTTVYAEGRWSQEFIDLFEQEVDSGVLNFQRDTDTDINRQDYSVGFNTSPLPRMTLSARYRHGIHENDYEHLVDTEEGYPAFITAQKFTSDEIMSKLTLRPMSRLSVSFMYQLYAMDIDTTTKSVAILGVPGGTIQSGNYDAMIYSVSATVTPISRLYLTGLFSFQDTRTIGFANGDPAILKYVGNVYTVLSSAGYALDEKTDVTIQYTYSRSDNFTDNSTVGLPLGLDFQRHGLAASLSRRISKNVAARLGYGFYEYNEGSSGGFNDYKAHLASASCSIAF
jgi:hypothetical protein